MVAACDHDQTGSRKRGLRLERAPGPKQMPSAERLRRIDQDDVNIATQLQVLKAIIKNEPPHAALPKLKTAGEAIGSHTESNPVAQTRFEQLHFIGGGFDRRFPTRSRHGGLPTIPTGENADAVPFCKQPLREA